MLFRVLHDASSEACSPPMKMMAWILLLLTGISASASAAISPRTVVVLYNSAVPESLALAEMYREARGIPEENLIALKMPIAADITREEYEKSILKPLRSEFEQRAWWQRQSDAHGMKMPVVNRMQALVLMKGVPLRIKPAPKPAQKPGEPVPPVNLQNPTLGHDEASVDSELAILGVEGLSVDGALPNQFYKSSKSFEDAKLPFLMLTARIDAPTVATCERMIRDAVEAEKGGLWGMAYIDIANKFPQGDQWLETVVTENSRVGIPSVVDRYADTLPKNYPMNDAAIYYGWYDWNVSGPFLNNRFQFCKGAIAMHLHSFSAEQLTNAAQNWSGALLEKGAAVTIGNVYEPYLHLTHDFGLLHQRLLEGFSWGEACWMAMPATSWQGVVLGDPLYRPFRRLDGSGMKQNREIPYRALRAATMEWGKNPHQRFKQLGLAADRMKNGVLAEALGLDYLAVKDRAAAAKWFRSAQNLYPDEVDQLRQDFHLISIDRSTDRKDLAIRSLRDAQVRYDKIPEADALKAWLDILDPPPPPPADPTKVPAVKKP